MLEKQGQKTFALKNTPLSHSQAGQKTLKPKRKNGKREKPRPYLLSLKLEWRFESRDATLAKVPRIPQHYAFEPPGETSTALEGFQLLEQCWSLELSMCVLTCTTIVRGSLVGSLLRPLWALFGLGRRRLRALLLQPSSLLGCLDLSQEGHGGLAGLRRFWMRGWRVRLRCC